MNKITLSILFFSAISFSQSISVGELDNSKTNLEILQCSKPGTDGTFDNGTSFTQNLNRIVAQDIAIGGMGSFILENISLHAFIGAIGSGVNAAFVNVYYYEDNNGAPGTLLDSEMGIVPTNQTVVGSNLGMDIWNVEFDVIDYTFLEETQSGLTVYWIGISLEATDGSDVLFEDDTFDQYNLSGVAYDDGSGNFVVNNDREGVYVFFGQCGKLGSNENIANLVSVYPNPTTDILNVKFPANVTVNSATLVNLLGADTGLRIMNGTINTSTLSNGVYTLILNTSSGTMTQKIIKQ